MKTPRLIIFTAALALAVLPLAFVPGCDSTTGKLTPQGAQTLTDAEQIAQLALTTYTAYEAAKSGTGKVSPAQVATIASADLDGVAALAQANVGTTPAAANLAQGAANPAAAQQVVAQLPQTPITQGTVNNLFAAAQQAAP